MCVCVHVIVCPCARKAENNGPASTRKPFLVRWAEVLPKFIDARFSRSNLPLVVWCSESSSSDVSSAPLFIEGWFGSTKAYGMDWGKGAGKPGTLFQF